MGQHGGESMLPVRRAAHRACVVLVSVLGPIVGLAKDAVPCPLNQVCNQKPTTATVLQSPKVYVVWWGWGGSDPDGLKPVMRSLFQNIGGSKYLNTVRQYDSFSGRCGNPTDLWGAELSDDTNPLPVDYPTNDQFNAEATWAIGQFNPAPVDDAVIVVALPKNNPAPNGFCGQHHSVDRPGHPRAAVVEMPYQANIVGACYPTANTAASSTTAVAMHELAEAITDPRYDDPSGDQLAWVNNAGAEIADICGGALPVDLTATGGTTTVAGLWSNAASVGSCVFARATRRNRFFVDSTYNLQYSYRDDYGGSGGWASWGKPPGLNLVSSPGVASWANGRIDAFAIDSGGNLSHAYWVNPGPPGWNSWGSPSGYTLINSPDAASWRPTRIDVVATANNGSTTHVFHRYWWSGLFPAWQDWGTPSGVTIATRATLAAWGPDRFDVFVTSNASPPDVWHGWSTDGTTIAGWNNWGHPSVGMLYTSPDASSWGDQHIAVFVVGSDQNLWSRTWDHGTFGAWWNTGKPASGLTSAPGAAGGGELRTFINGDSTTDWEQVYDNGNKPWTDLAGSPWTRPDISSW